jgi:hypothetical protein
MTLKPVAAGRRSLHLPAVSFLPGRSAPGGPAGSRGTAVRALYVAAAAALTGSGYIHGQLYADGYRFIHVVGVLFLVQSAASFALALLLLVAVFVRPSVLVPLGAAGAALGALAGFVASRTVGVFGFTERGLQPAPQALLSVLTEIAVVLLLSTAAVIRIRSLTTRAD